MTTKLIVLLGHCNDKDGKFSPVTKARCGRAAQVLREEDGSLLPTGSLGDHFNRTETPHWEYLKKQLEEFRVPPEKILRGTNTDGTLDDLLPARRMCVRVYGG